MDEAVLREEAGRVLARRVLERRRAARHPADLMCFMRAPDERRAESFRFPLDDPESGWAWQRDLLGDFMGNQRVIVLKSRQLGATWLACGFVVWTMLYRPGSLCLMFRQKEEEAQENVRRCWQLLNSLPAHLWNGASVQRPMKGALPSDAIELSFAGGEVSRVVAMTSASASGHGKTAAVVVLDEFARIDRAAEIRKAVGPAAGRHGKILVVSTANGVANPETGEGNMFHWLWQNADDAGYLKRFLPWMMHPERDQDWYDNDPEVRELLPHERAEQYPSNEDEAFALSKQVFFDVEDLAFYGQHVREPQRRFSFEAFDARRARLADGPEGIVREYVAPSPDGRYAIGADVATGRGADYSTAVVVDLSRMMICAEMRGRIDPDQFAMQLHYLGRRYNTALIAVETAGGYGEAVIIPLRDGRAGRPPYPRLYRHVMSSRADLPEAKPYGFPTNTKTRPLILNGLRQAVRERQLPFVTRWLMDEMRTFMAAPNPGESMAGAWPRAQKGSHDDMVFAAAIALEMYRLRGSHPQVRKRRPASGKAPYPWLVKT